jgi:hypothetical protein
MRRKERRTYSCLACGKVQEERKNCANMYCNNRCQADHVWRTVTIPRIERGDIDSSSRVIKKYLAEKRGYRCEECGLSYFWNGKPLVLQLDHIDGNSDNNLPSNLRLICPNCHSQTDTFCSSGLDRSRVKQTKRNSYNRKFKSGN